MEDIRKRILELIDDIEQMIENNIDKKSIEIKRKELDKLLDLYLNDI